MLWSERIKRYILFLIGVFIMAGGVVFTVRSALGTTPLASFPFALYSIFEPLSFGTATFLNCMLLLIAQLVLMRRNFDLKQFAQIPLAIFLGLFQDVWGFLLGDWAPETYPIKLVVLVVGCCLTALGVGFQVTANVVMDSATAFTKDISDKFGFDFGKCKICVDWSFVVIAVIVDLAVLHTVVGVREGTVICAFLVGIIAGFLKKKFVPMNRFLMGREKYEATYHPTETVGT